MIICSFTVNLLFHYALTKMPIFQSHVKDDCTPMSCNDHHVCKIKELSKNFSGKVERNKKTSNYY